jgi:hypothetical protein
MGGAGKYVPLTERTRYRCNKKGHIATNYPGKNQDAGLVVVFCTKIKHAPQQDVLIVYDSKRSDSARHFEGLSDDCFDNWDPVDGKEENAGSGIGIPPLSISSRGYWVDGIKLEDKTAWTTNACQILCPRNGYWHDYELGSDDLDAKEEDTDKSQYLSIQDSKECTRKKMMMPSFPH